MIDLNTQQRIHTGLTVHLSRVDYQRKGANKGGPILGLTPNLQLPNYGIVFREERMHRRIWNGQETFVLEWLAVQDLKIFLSKH